ncbi:creatininase family protein [Geminicoccus roseus]|uniref:creatininase family protein n=1 Tax=Geminicoccus roseus TaxID=404900 RepID=UPI0004238D16|nr:creatininase family protein [Geminicoccus roseus]
MARRWEELRSPEFRDLDPERTVAVMPLGAIEQHGPHLPVMVDARLAGEVTDRALTALAADLPVLRLPTMPVGKSDEHLDYPGTLTFSAETVLRVWIEIGQSVARAGVRKLVMVNGHGGQIQPMQMAARELRIGSGMFAVACNWWQFGYPDGLFSEEELRFGIHAGAVETSMMRAVEPGLVRMELAQDFVPATRHRMASRFPRLAAAGAAGFGWMAQDIHPDGAAGDASAAWPDHGEAALNHAAEGLAALLREVVDYPLEGLERTTVR